MIIIKWLLSQGDNLSSGKQNKTFPEIVYLFVADRFQMADVRSYRGNWDFGKKSLQIINAKFRLPDVVV